MRITANFGVVSRRMRIYIGCFLAVLLFLAGSMHISAKSEETAWGNVSVSARLDEKKIDEIVIELKPDAAFLTAKKGETAYLFALRPSDYQTELKMLSPTATTTVDKTITFRLKNDGTNDRLFLGYVIAIGEGADYRALHTPVMVQNADVLSKKETQDVKPLSIKGIVASQNLGDEILHLGVSHAVIPIILDHYISVGASDAAYAVSYDGVKVNFDKNKIEQLDAQVSSLTRAGVHLYFRFLLDGSARLANTAAAQLYAQDAAVDASLYGMTVQSKEAYLMLRGIFTYFSSRYAEDADIDYILGYQVNERDVWNQVGGMSDAAYAAEYAKVFQIADIALRSVNRNSRVYVPMSNLWAAGKPFLTAFAEEMDGGAWGVAIAPYASSPRTDAVWNDANALDSADTAYITAANLQVLKNFLSDEMYLYNGDVRSVIIDDFAVHGTSGDSASETRQAASLAYAYYQAVQSDFIDAFIYHRILDLSDEACSYGLLQTDGTEKAAYPLYRLIDTNKGEAAAKDLAAVIGKKKWSNIIQGFSYKKAQHITLIENTALDTESALKKYTKVPYLDFMENNTAGFVPFSHVEEVSYERITTPPAGINDSVLQMTSYPMPHGEAASILRHLSKPTTALGDAYALAVTMRAAALTASGGPMQVQLRLSGTASGERALYVGTADITADGFVTVVFPIRDFSRAADSVDNIWLSVSGPADAEGGQGGYTLQVNDIAVLQSKTAWIGRLFLWIFLAVLVIFLIFAVLVIRQQLRRKKRRRQQLEARRRALEHQRIIQKTQQFQQQPRQPRPQSQYVRRQEPSQPQQQMARRTAQRMPQMRRPEQQQNSSQKNRR